MKLITQKQFLEKEKTFYKKLYSSKNVDPINNELDVLFRNNLLTPLSDDQSRKDAKAC